MTEREQLERAIDVLEGQRATLGNAVIDPAIAGIRQQLDELAQRQSPDQQRKLATLLFADIVGSTEMSQGLDAEEVVEVMDGALQRLAVPVEEHGGRVTRFMGDGFKAVFGVPVARENDAEQAVRAGLRILEVARDYACELADTRRLSGFDVRVGINTGLVVAGGFSEAEDTVMGVPVNLGARMESAAPPGGLLISCYTYRHVRGVFNVRPLDPIVAKGFCEPVPVYLVESAKPRAFRMPTRGVEGIETRMVGRKAELATLREAFLQTIESGQARTVTVTGEAGVGKSRLLYEFTNWVELRPEMTWIFQGRATEQMTDTPFGLLHDVLADRFQILNSDSAAVARHKLVAGVTGFMGEGAEEQADFIGHLVGLDLSGSRHLSGILSEGGQIRQRAFHYLVQFFRAVSHSDDSPVLLLLEDLQWADEGSLDLIEHLTRSFGDVPLLTVCLARPALYARRSLWSADHSFHSRIHLERLSKLDSICLTDELLQKVGHPPVALCELLVNEAEGNPFYMEELLKMCIDDGVVVKGAEEWRVELSRLDATRIPPTLTGVLQARLDRLPREEKAVLQWASVVGHVFWDGAVAEAGRGEAEREVVLAALARLARRELILQRDGSAFEGARESMFAHAMLHEITYQSVLKRLRREYHRQVASWLVAHSVQRVGEYAGLIAKHFELAEDVERAVAYLRRAGEQAMQTSSHREELGFYERALALLPEEGVERQRAALVCAVGWSWSRLGDFAKARDNLASALALAREAGEEGTQTAALIGLGEVTKHQGGHSQAQMCLEEALSLARARDDERATAAALRALGGLAWTQGHYAEATQHADEALARFSVLSDRVGMSRCHNLMGVILNAQGGSAEAEQHYQVSLELAHWAGDRMGEGMALLNLGELARMKGDLVTARKRYEESLEINADIGGHQDGAAVNIINLGLVSLAEGDCVQAMQRFRHALELFSAIEARAGIIITLVCVAALRAKMGDPGGALELIGLAMAQPAAPQQARDDAEPIVTELEQTLGPEAVATGLERGAGLDLDATVKELMA